MTLDLDTFLVSLYTIVDDLYQERYAHTKPGVRVEDRSSPTARC